MQDNNNNQPSNNSPGSEWAAIANNSSIPLNSLPKENTSQPQVSNATMVDPNKYPAPESIPILKFNSSSSLYQEEEVKTAPHHWEAIKHFVVFSIFTLVAIGIVAIGFFAVYNNSSTLEKWNPLQAFFPKPPYEAITDAFTKTVNAKSFSISYTSTIDTSITQSSTGITQNLKDHIDGNISGTTDGKNLNELSKIYNDQTPNKSVNIGVTLVNGNDMYIESGSTVYHLTLTEYQKLVNSSPTDASIYGTDMIEDILNPHTALFAIVNKQNLVPLNDQTINGEVYSKYEVYFSADQYINALSQEGTIPPKIISDSKTILQDSTLDIIYYVDKTTGYVTKIHIDANNLTQLPTTTSTQLGLSTTQNISLDANLSQFGLHKNITAPTATTST